MTKVIMFPQNHIVTDVKFEDTEVTCSRCGRVWPKDEEGTVNDILYSVCTPEWLAKNNLQLLAKDKES